MGKVADRVQETTTVAGTGTATLLGATTDYRSFASAFATPATSPVYYLIDDTAGNWEVGLGTYTVSGTTLARTTVLASSNAGSLVGFAAGTKVVTCVSPAVVIQSRGKQTVTDPGTGNQSVTIDCTVTDAFRCVMASHANTLTFAMSGMVDGQVIQGNIVQDATGGRLVAFTAVKWQYGVAPTASPGANAIDKVVLTYDATDGWTGSYTRAYA